MMGIKNTMLAAAASVAIFSEADKCAGKNNGIQTGEIPPSIEQVEVPDSTKTNNQEDIQKQIFVCLETDEKGSYTYTNILESIKDPENTVLEYPIDPLFETYGETKRPHPLRPGGVSRTYRALLGRGGIEASDIPQKLKPRDNEITSETTYQVGDTLRFALIDSRIKGAFPTNLSEQLKESGFESFSDKDSLEVNTTLDESNLGKWYINGDKKSFILDPHIDESEESLDNGYIYDIVVKSLPGGKSALAVYRDGTLFMATYASIGTLGHKTRTGQHEIIGKNPYKRSLKYDNSAMPFALNYSGGFYIHQGNVSGYPLSHGCVRLPGVYANILYSLVINKEHVDVFIDNNLYKSK